MSTMKSIEEKEKAEGTEKARTTHGRALLQTDDSLRSFWYSRNIDLNFTFRDWKTHKSNFRHFKHLMPKNIIQSATFRRLLFPDLLVVGITSTAVTSWNMYCVESEKAKAIEVAGNMIDLHHTMITLPTLPFTLSAFALGLLVTFRTQSGNNRFVQARKDWGAIINTTRDLASRILARFPHEQTDNRRFGVRLVKTFPYALKFHLTEDGWSQRVDVTEDMSDADVEDAKAVELRRQIVNDIWTGALTAREEAYLDALLDKTTANRPLHVLHELSRLNAISSRDDAENAGTTIGNPIVSSGIDARICDLTNAMGSCERILRTPIYTSYTRHASRFLTLWCNALPMALYPLVGPELTIPFSLAISFVMFGIEDIGIRVEEPFSVLPLFQYCDAIRNSCEQLEKHSPP